MKNINTLSRDINIENTSESSLALKLNIEEKLALFDKNFQSIEVMASAPIGKEFFNKHSSTSG